VAFRSGASFRVIRDTVYRPQSDRSVGRTSLLRRVCVGAALSVALVVFGTICLLWSVLAGPLLLLPKRLGQPLGRGGIRWGFRLFFVILRVIGVGRFDVSGLRTLRADVPVVLAPNHPSLLDALLIVAYVPRVVCVLKAALLNNLFLGTGARLAGYIRHEPPRSMIRSAVEQLALGNSVLLFPEGTRTTAPPLNPLQAGVGIIAEQAGVPIQALIIEVDTPYASKGNSLLRNPSLPFRYAVRLGERQPPPDDVRQSMAELERHLRQTLGAPGRGGWLAAAGNGAAPPAPRTRRPARRSLPARAAQRSTATTQSEGH
jgi:1-acyl-sn-glycerol-3-phosphate acyltransferase